jgi:hypothetical protein
VGSTGGSGSTPLHSQGFASQSYTAWPKIWRYPLMQLTLTEAETVMLAEILESYRSNLRMEIADTDAMDFRERLKQHEAFLDKVLRQLQEAQSESA